MSDRPDNPGVRVPPLGNFRRSGTSIVPIRPVPVLFIVRAFVIAPEERYLERRFGADYVAYMQRVPRWL